MPSLAALTALTARPGISVEMARKSVKAKAAPASAMGAAASSAGVVDTSNPQDVAAGDAGLNPSWNNDIPGNADYFASISHALNLVKASFFVCPASGDTI